MAKSTCSTNSGAKFLKSPRQLHPSGYPTCTKRLFESAEMFRPFGEAFANPFLAVMGGESQIIKILRLLICDEEATP